MIVMVSVDMSAKGIGLMENSTRWESERKYLLTVLPVKRFEVNRYLSQNLSIGI